MEKIKFLEFTVKSFFRHQLLLKMFHFQTKQYGAHKASDTYLEKFADHLDKYIEVAQGAFGRLDMKELDIKFIIANDDTIIAELDKFIVVLKEYDTILVGYSELLNIRDEIVADAEQLKYLLTFK